jgi:hypothetical protein
MMLKTQIRPSAVGLKAASNRSDACAGSITRPHPVRSGDGRFAPIRHGRRSATSPHFRSWNCHVKRPTIGGRLSKWIVLGLIFTLSAFWLYAMRKPEGD